MIDLLPLQLLGGHVRDRADDRPVLRGGPRGVGARLEAPLLLPELRQAEVEHLHPAVARAHHVRRLQVPVHDPLVVRRRQRLRQRHRHGEQVGLCHAPGRDERVEGLPLDQLHGQERDAVRLLDRMDGDDVGMIDRRDGARLALESLQAIGVPGQGRRQRLEGDGPPERRVDRLEHDSHPPLSDLLEEPVVGHGLSGPQAHRGDIRLSVFSPCTL